jgi:hypothetical protein
MARGRFDYLSYVLIGVGFVFTPLSFLTGTSTLAACRFESGAHGRIYQTFGIYPPGYRVRIDWAELMVYWNDGCNGHAQTLWFSIAGCALLLTGIVLYYRERAE